MAVDTSKWLCFSHLWDATLGDSGQCVTEEGVKASERSRSTTATINTNRVGAYVETLLPLPPDGVLKAGTYERSFRAWIPSAGPATVYVDLVVDGTTTYTSAAVSVANTTEATLTGQVAVGADITVTSSIVVRERLDALGGAASITFRPVHDESFFGVASGYSGCARHTPVLTLVSPAQGAHANPTLVDGPPVFALEGHYLYPADRIYITKYADTVSTAAHSASGATTQTVADDMDTLTTAIDSAGVRTFAVTADATRKPDALADTYYLLECKHTAGGTLMASTDAHVYLNVTRPMLTTLNGVDAAGYVLTTEPTPVVSWTNPNPAADRWQVRVYDTSDVLQHDSTETVSAATQYALPSSLANLTTLYVVVTVAKGTDWTVDSLRGYFRVDNTSTALQITSHSGTLDAPEVIATQAPTIAWAFTKLQAAYNAVVRDTATGAVTYESGWTASATESKALPAATLALGGTYAVQLQVKDTLGNIYGADEQVYLHVNEATIGAPALTGEADQTTAAAVTLEWAAPAVGDGDTLTYTVTLTDSGGQTTTLVVAGLSVFLGRLSADTYSWTVYATDEHDLDGAAAVADTFVISQAGSVPTVALVPWGPSTTTLPTSTWTYADADGDAQDAYEIEIDDDPAFASPLEDSGVVVATGAYHNHSVALSVGTWHRRVRVRTNAVDWSSWATDTMVVVAPTAQTNEVDLLHGATPITQAISKVEVSRRLDGPTAFRFSIDNFDGLQGGIADGDTLTLRLKDAADERLEFRGEVVSRTTGLLCEITCEDLAYKFDRWAVTLDLVNASIGEVVVAMVENPTGGAATGITAQVDEIEDPSTPGLPIRFGRFRGGGRSVKAWLDEFKRVAGLRWYLEWDGSAWIFHGFDPANASDWSITLKDDIDHSAESSTQARILDPPSLQTSRYPYINRVRYRAIQAGPPLPEGYGSYDEYLSEGTTGWTAYSGCVVASEGTAVEMGAASVKFTKTIAPVGVTATVPERLDFGYFLLPQAWREWTPVYWGQLLAKLRLTVTRDGTDEMTARVAAGRSYSPRIHWHWGANVGPGLTKAAAYVTGGVYGWDDGGYLWTTMRLAESGKWYSVPFRIQQYDLWRGPDGRVPLTNVNAIGLHVYQSSPLPAVVADGSSWVATLYVDDLAIVGVPSPDPQGYDLYVETAAVTAGTEVPIEDSLASVYLTSTIVETLARKRLALANKTYKSIGSLALSGIRNVPLTKTVPLALTTVGETGSSYPIAEISWQPLDSGDRTVLTVGDFPLDVGRGLERTIQRLSSAETSPFAI